MKVKLLYVNSGKEPWAEEAEALYFSKLKHFFTFEIHSIKSSSQGRDSFEEKRKIDSEKILKTIQPTDFVVLLDERGESLGSEAFAKKWLKIIESGKSSIVLVVGGAFGVTSEISERANYKLRLSDFVMNHHVAKIVLLEQVYRAMTIIKGIPYHNK